MRKSRQRERDEQMLARSLRRQPISTHPRVAASQMRCIGVGLPFPMPVRVSPASTLDRDIAASHACARSALLTLSDVPVRRRQADTIDRGRVKPRSVVARDGGKEGKSGESGCALAATAPTGVAESAAVYCLLSVCHFAPPRHPPHMPLRAEVRRRQYRVSSDGDR